MKPANVQATAGGRTDRDVTPRKVTRRRNAHGDCNLSYSLTPTLATSMPPKRATPSLQEIKLENPDVFLPQSNQSSTGRVSPSPLGDTPHLEPSNRGYGDVSYAITVRELQRKNKEIEREYTELHDINAMLEQENADLKHENAILKDRFARLKDWALDQEDEVRMHKKLLEAERSLHIEAIITQKLKAEMKAEMKSELKAEAMEEKLAGMHLSTAVVKHQTANYQDPTRSSISKSAATGLNKAYRSLGAVVGKKSMTQLNPTVATQAISRTASPVRATTARPRSPERAYDSSRPVSADRPSSHARLAAGRSGSPFRPSTDPRTPGRPPVTFAADPSTPDTKPRLRRGIKSRLFSSESKKQLSLGEGSG
ncbi:hypothetical protein IWX90DRAFT_486113 [Phyllosticta citrichinensis]|uniref:Uncharacterized protein n=1 Tax=Phyllosticta citrichinensis TaxID=1130410 RepID=A0ABR1XXW8_9PEZI